MDVTINEGSSFLICDEQGDINLASKQGLFNLDTRFLSRLELTISGHKFTKLTGRPVEFYSSIHYLTNPSFDRIRSGTIEVSRMRLLGDGLHEDLDIASYNERSVNLSLKLTFDTDFANVFEVKAGRLKQQHKVSPVFDEQKNAFRFIFKEKDYYRETRIRITEKPSRIVNNELVFDLVLEPRETRHFCIDVLPLTSDKEIKTKYTCESFGVVKIERPLKQFKKDVAKIDTNYIALQQAYEQSINDLAKLMLSEDTGLWGKNIPAAGIPWFLTLFGRDSLITALQTLLVAPKIAKGVLSTLAKYQGTKIDPENEETPGKILHEVRFFNQTDSKTKETSVSCYYGSIDATLLFIIVLYEYLAYTNDLGFIKQMADALKKALEWIDNYGDSDNDGYLEYKRSTDRGLENQAWKDSFDSVAFSNAVLAEPPIAMCEVQGYAFNAKIKGSALLKILGENALADKYEKQALTLKQKFNKDFWIEKQNYFAEGLDKDKKQINSITSNCGHLLWSNIVDEEKAKIITTRLLSPEMFSGWGIRTLSRSARQYNPLSYHNGSVWPHDNSIIACGLYRYGFAEEARQIIDGIIQASQHFPYVRLPELFCGFDRSTTYIPVDYPASNSPQAWAAGSTAFMINTMLGISININTRKNIWLRPIPLSKIRTLKIENTTICGQRVDLMVTNKNGSVKTEILNNPDLEIHL